jgi:signal transduction histidine kinase
MSGAIPAGGAGLAEAAGMLERETRPPPSGPHSAHAFPLAVVAISALFVLGLWLADYPRWRIVATALLLASMIPRTSPASVLARVRIRELSVEPAVATATHLAVVALTGGLRSPFLVAVIGPFTGILQSYGWSRATKWALGMIGAAALAMALLPAAWFGPQVTEPALSILTALIVIAVAATNAGLFVMMTRALNAIHGEVDRARGQLAAQALARARELEQLGAQLSHELKNPLGAIKTLVQLSARDAGDERSRERLQVAEAEIERMNGILKEYLSFSRPLEKLRLEPVELGALADEVILILGTQAAHAGVALRRRGEARAEIDARRLKEALFNLVANALEATPRGGSVQVDIGERDGAVRVSVRDSGRGMPRDVLARVGTPFFTTREEGTGLGVAMARAAFVQHGGGLEYASAEGEGTTATGTLPIRRRDGRSDGAPAAR